MFNTEHELDEAMAYAVYAEKATAEAIANGVDLDATFGPWS